MSDTIRKYKRSNNFTTVNNEYLKDQSISWKAKGLITYIMSLPEDWKLNLSDLKKRSKDKREATASGLRELIESGYCRRIKLRNLNGTFSGSDYEIADIKIFEVVQPETENPISVNAITEKPFSGNPSLLNTNSTKETYIQNTKGSKASLQNFGNKKYGSTNNERQQEIESRRKAALREN